MPASPSASAVSPSARALDYWPRLPGAALALAIAKASETHQHLLVVGPSPRALQLLQDEICFFLSGQHESICVLPGWECLPYDHYSPHPEITSQRLQTLSRLAAGQPFILLLSIEQVLHRRPPPAFVQGSSFNLSRGDILDPVALRSRLSDSGYLAVSRVMSQGEYAVRGGIIDVFPMGTELPFRLDLFGEELEDIRFFDPATQKSIEQTEHLSILPAREFPTDARAIEQFRSAYRRDFSGDPQASLIYREVSQGRFPAGIEFFLPLFFDTGATLFDFLPEDTCWVLPHDWKELTHLEWATLQDRYLQSQVDRERRPLPPEALSLTPKEAAVGVEQFSRIEVSTNSGKAALTGISPFQAEEPAQYPVDHKSAEPFSSLLTRLRQSNAPRVLLNAETMGRAQTLIDLLSHHRIDAPQHSNWGTFLSADDNKPGVIVSPLDRGLLLPSRGVEIIVESQLYGERVHQRRRRTRSGDPEAIIRSIAELHSGDPVVHADHGVGRFGGLSEIGVGDYNAEFLMIHYQDEGKLYVPVLNIGVLSRYIGGDGESAPLHRLGGDQWEKARARATRRAHDAAAELLKTQALRQIRRGTAFHIPEDDYAAFCNGFPFDETADQEQAIAEVLGDLVTNRPMDRLVCGDVGFGKTEVALRAAFVVVSNSRQVAILTPTTLLAQQHFDTFQERFTGHAVRVELLSRFQSQSQTDEILAGVQDGKVDIVIGTHRLLQRDIDFARLGLVIIDEEHRFGVRQKEVLKQMREAVDILALTATPIPRTLNIALSGIRAISLIGSAPAGRVSINTSVHPYSKGLVREACLREIHRGGQIYYLHNEVRSIERTAAELRDLIPEAQINVAHGQMRKIELEPVMRDFYHQRFNLLVCSTIIESGIDVPTANTIVINRADRFGLAQLHQLRGRVGRSRHQAYAFLLTPPKELMAPQALRRLEAIAQLTELGAGFALAHHDLEIRGAGELLGEGQSGTIEEIGFSLYSEYLNRAVRDLSPGSEFATGQPLPTELPELDLSVPAYLPETFLPDVHSRLLLYQRVSACSSAEDLYELQLEVIDRFGLLPQEAKALFRLASLRLKGAGLGVRLLQAAPQGGRIAFEPGTIMDPTGLTYLLTQQSSLFNMTSPVELAIRTPLVTPESRINFFEWLMRILNSETPLTPPPDNE